MVLDPFAQQALALGGAQHRGVDESGRDRVDGDPFRAQFEGQGLGEPDHSRLGRHVMGHERLPPVGAGRRDVDDPAPPLLDHVGHDGLAAVEGAGEVDGEDAAPLLGRDGEEAVEPVESGAVHQDGRPAELLPYGGHPFIDLPSVRDIDPQSACRTPCRRNFCRGRLGRLAVAVEDGDRVVVGGQPFADGVPDPRRAARHDGCALETHWIGSLPCRVVRCMSRGEAASYRQARCNTPRLSQITKSPTSQWCR